MKEYTLLNCKTTSGLFNIQIKNKKIDYVGKENPTPKDTFDVKKNWVIPGMIDPHVHVRDLDLSYKEDWKTASRAAIHGGVTMIGDMPNTIPATTDHIGLETKLQARKKSLIPSFLYLGATNQNWQEIENLILKYPDIIRGIKIFFAVSSHNDALSDEALEHFFKISNKYDIILLFHNEIQSCLDVYSNKYIHNILNHNILRNRKCAIEGTKKIIEYTQKYQTKSYICHVSTSEEIKLIRQVKNSIEIFCEITPHHLLLDESILKNVGNYGKVNPPLRTKKDTESLWQAIDDGTVDCFGSDHAPHLKIEKDKEYSKSPSGFPGLETSLPLLLTQWKHKKISMDKLINLTSQNPAAIFNLPHQGRLEEGFHADLVIFNDTEEDKVQPENFYSKAKYSPFSNMELSVKLKKTIVRGKIYNKEI